MNKQNTNSTEMNVDEREVSRRRASDEEKIVECLEALVVAVKFRQKLAADKAAKKSRQSKI